jgi:TRAP-type uncharacterized transport system fused permease subunit
MAWKYAITAFLIPFIFVLLPAGRSLLLHWDGISPIEGIWTIIAAFIGIGMLASGCSGWLFKRSSVLERFVTIVGALAFVYPSRVSDVIGFACLVLVIVMQKLRKGEGAPVATAT